jgi:hypothetical protein
MKTITLVLIFSALSAFSGKAQNDSIPYLNSDRPLQSESPYLMKKGYFQIETGAMYIERDDKEKHLERIRLGTTNLRYGLFSNFEVRLGDSYEFLHVQTNEDSHDSTESGWGPLTAGFKVFVVRERKWLPEMAILGTITFRHLGNEAFRPTFSYPTGKLLCSHTISKFIKFGYNIGFSYSGETADGFFLYSVFPTFYITPKLIAFAEVYGNFDHGDAPNNRGDAGLSYLIRKNLQVDLSAGIAFDPDIDRFFASVGVFWRIPR